MTASPPLLPDPWNPEVLKRIDALIETMHADSSASHRNDDLIREIIVTALKASSSQIARGDLKILNRALRELRYAFKIFKPYRNRRKVTLFGSARTPRSSPEYKTCLNFAKALAKKNYMVITGAGPGIMMAGNEGAGVGNSFGINIRLPFEQSANKFILKNPLYVDCRFFFTRKLLFVKETSAAALFPGGFGTHDEGFELLTLVQTGKCDILPLVFIDKPGGSYWRDWKKFIVKQLLKPGKISPEDMSLFKVTDSVDEACEEIFGFYKNYHSMRYVKDKLVIRLNETPDASALRRLNKSFADILVKGKFALSGPLEEEEDETSILHLPRLVLPFNRFNFGRLRQLIDALNKG